jgi:hypothetical protein
MAQNTHVVVANLGLGIIVKAGGSRLVRRFLTYNAAFA